MTLEELALQGKCTANNTMAASLADKLVGIRKENIRMSLSDFENIPHRLEFVARLLGIDFINDSWATNVNSTWYAMETVDTPIIWIAGGCDKNIDYTKLFALVSKKVKSIICIGNDNSRIFETFNQKVDKIYEADSVSDAVKIAYSIGKQNDTVLLSPACASFDRFENYEDRGEKFIMAVKQL